MKENLSSKPFDMALLCASTEPLNFIDGNGASHTFTPDKSKGFFQFDFCYGFPNETDTGLAVYHSIIGANYKELEDQYLSYEHQMGVYDPSKKMDDRIIGHVVAVSFPRPRNGGWKLSDPQPNITGVAAFYKKSQGMRKIIGEHLTGRHEWTVSMEIDWVLEDSGFAVKRGTARDGKGTMSDPTFNTSPQDFLDAGWEYVPFDKAPADLVATFSPERNKVVKNYKGRKVTVLVGGIDKPVHYAGLGLVKYGGEKKAKINRLVASKENAGLGGAIRDLPRILQEAAARLVKP